MPDCKDTISEFLRNMGVPVEFTLVPGNERYYYGDGLFGGVTMRFWVYTSANAFAITLPIGWVPKVGVAPLYRQMLNQNYELLDAKYCILEHLPPRQGGQIFLVANGFVDHLTLAQFKAALDNLTAQFWAKAVPLIRDFQIPREVPL